MDAAELLETTADRFESGVYEWIRHGLESDEGYCFIGALSYTAIGQAAYEVEEIRQAAAAMIKVADPRMEKMRKIYEEACAAHYPGCLDGFFAEYAELIVAHWNDTEVKDKAEVVEVMKQAAKNLRNEA